LAKHLKLFERARFVFTVIGCIGRQARGGTMEMTGVCFFSFSYFLIATEP